MEALTQQQNQKNKTVYPAYRSNNRIISGAILVVLGMIILTKRLGILFFPVHTGPLFIIAAGLYIGVKHRFRHFASWFLIALGILFAIPKFTVLGVLSTKLAAPVTLVLLGIYLIIRTGRKTGRNFQKLSSVTDKEELDLENNFGEQTTVVTSKDFKGGRVSNTFGSTKINMLQAEVRHQVVLDLKVNFGSVELIVPDHWEVIFKLEHHFASVEEKRYLRIVSENDKRQLVVSGTCSFGSVVVKSL